MTAIVRLLGTGNHPEITADEKLAAQIIHRELNEADEANLLDENDMHVFDHRPLVDPLHLVCCNGCKKPVKASQYAAHADRCKLIISLGDTSMELDHGNFHKKSQIQGRKKLKATHDPGSATGGRDKSESLGGDDDVVSESTFCNQTGTLPFYSMEAKNIPSPLATKAYHSQGSHRLRSALGRMYLGAATRNQDCGPIKKSVNDYSLAASVNTERSQSLPMTSKDDTQVQVDTYAAFAVHNPDQISAESSELRVGSSGGYSSPVGFKNGSPDSSFRRSALAVDGTSVVMMKARYHPAAYPFPSNQGSALGRIQQSNESVPVG